MLVRNLQLYESILSKKRQKNLWYRGVDEYGKNDLDFNPDLDWSSVPSMWFASELNTALAFSSIDGYVYEIMLEPNLNLWNAFDETDWKSWTTYYNDNEEDIQDIVHSRF
jgi:hypothetical protein